MIRRVLFACLLMAFPISAVAQDTPARLPVNVKEIEASFETEWFGLYLQGKKIGYVSTTRGKTGVGENAVYRESLVISMKLTSFGQKVEFRARQHIDFDLKPPFALRAAQLEEYDGKSK